ncbi:MAG: IS1634 family transposase [Deltaproteobacteria bacterium]|jgi:transposase|nr:IS1634 family transposase [Deltaproteobacteria bacterium]
MNQESKFIDSNIKYPRYPYLFFKVDHLAIISAFLYELGLVDIIDHLIPKSPEDTISHGEALKFFILNSFTSKRDASYKSYLSLVATPTFLFFDRDIPLDAFNDDALVKSLEAVNEYGASLFFSKIFQHIAPRIKHMPDLERFQANVVRFHYIDLNPDSMKYDGFVKLVRDSENAVTTQELLRRTLSFGLITNSLGVPVFMKPFPANSIIKDVDNLVVNQFSDSIKKNINDLTQLLFVADRYQYRQKNINNLSTNYIVRILEQYKSLQYIKYSEMQLTPYLEDNKYSYYATKSTFGDIEQTVLLVHSTELEKIQKNKLEQNILKELITAKDTLKALCAQEFTSETDAIKACYKWKSKLKWHAFESVETVRKLTIIPENDETINAGDKVKKSYYVIGTIVLDSGAVAKELLGSGRFLLATNNLSLSPEEILSHYLDHLKISHSSTFLQGNKFRIPKIMLKTPERISGLECFLALSILITSLLEIRLHKNFTKIRKDDEKIPKNLINDPTLLVAFRKLRGIKAVLMRDNKRGQWLFRMKFRVPREQSFIIKAFGSSASSIYSERNKEISKEQIQTILHNIQLS